MSHMSDTTSYGIQLFMAIIESVLFRPHFDESSINSLLLNLLSYSIGLSYVTAHLVDRHLVVMGQTYHGPLRCL